MMVGGSVLTWFVELLMRPLQGDKLGGRGLLVDGSTNVISLYWDSMASLW
ncbi:hypothetical protein FLAVO9AF_850005 [Flavobacterium sp. 9AF]|nr:hypothetical protein FLAVO9AF_850005 [Flavobacterium sp. 9AF]